MVHACPMGLFGPLGGVGHHHGLYIPHGDTYFHGNIRPRRHAYGDAYMGSSGVVIKGDLNA
jgi:hypothetical protein